MTIIKVSEGYKTSVLMMIDYLDVQVLRMGRLHGGLKLRYE